jgi:hypothetical protein
MPDPRGNSGEHVEGMRYSPRPPDSAEIMQHFDILPAPIRRAIAEAPANFNTIEIAKALRSGFPAKRMEIDLRLASKEFIKRAYAERAKGGC